MKNSQTIASFFSETYEYAFTAVPTEGRKSSRSLLLIFAGFAFSFSGLNVGAQVGHALPFGRAVGVCVLGNLLLYCIALFWGLLGFKTGCTGASLVRLKLGEKTAGIFSLLIVTAIIGWAGMNGELLAQSLVAIFPHWPLAIPLTTMLIIMLGTATALQGWRSLVRLSRLCLLPIILLTLNNLCLIGRRKSGFSFVFTHQPTQELMLGIALTLIVGNFILSATTMPDLCRFAENRRTVIGRVTVYAALLSVCNICGILIAQATAANSLHYGFYLLGLVGPSILWMVLCIFTTQSVNMYTGSLAIQNLIRRTTLGGNISHKLASCFIGAASIITGVIGVNRHLAGFTTLLVLVITPLTGMMAAEQLTGRHRNAAPGALSLSVWCLTLFFDFIVWQATGIKPWFCSILIAGLVYGVARHCGTPSGSAASQTQVSANRDQ